MTAADLRDVVEGVLAESGRVDGLFAAGGRGAREVRYVCAVPDGDLIVRCPAGGRRADARRPPPAPGLGRARGARPPRRLLRRARAAAPAGGPSGRPRGVDHAGRGRRRPPGRGGPRPRRHHRVGPLPLPHGRRAHPPPGRPPLPQAPRRRAARRGPHARTRWWTCCATPAGRAPSPTPSPPPRPPSRPPGGGRRPRCAAPARCCSSSSASTTTSTTSGRSAPGWVSPRGRWPSRR